MIEQIHETLNHNDNIETELNFQSTMIFSNIVLCHNCGMEMQFVENDVIFGEEWYHAKCWQDKQGDKLNV